MDRYMKYAIVYSSRTGNTKMLADTIEKVLPKDSIIYCGPADDKALQADRIYIGFWTNQGVCDDETKAFLGKLTNQEVFLFGTAGFGGSSTYFDKFFHRTRSLLPKDVKFVASYMCQGKMPMSVRERYVKMQQLPNPPIPNLDKMIKNFDAALEHPSKDDLRNFSNWLKEMV